VRTALQAVPGVRDEGVEIDFDNEQAIVSLGGEGEFPGNAALISALEAIESSTYSGSIEK